MGKFAPEIIEAVKEVGKNCQALNVVAITGGYNNDLFDAAIRLHDNVGYLIEALENNDENMDPARTKLPNLDEVFAGDPVSEYVDAIYDYASGKGTPESVMEATKKLAASQNGIVVKAKEYPNTVEGFLDAICDSINLSDDRDAQFKNQMKNAVVMLKSRPGASCEYVGTHSDGTTIKGSVSIKGSVLTITVNDKTFVYDEKDQTAEKAYDGFCSEYPTEPVADQEELFYQLHPEENTKEMSLADYVTYLGFGKYDPNELLEVIQGILDRRGSFSKDDLKLIRFYLKQKPFNDPEKINELSDRALVLAWKQHKYARNFM